MKIKSILSNHFDIIIINNNNNNNNNNKTNDNIIIITFSYLLFNVEFSSFSSNLIKFFPVLRDRNEDKAFLLVLCYLCHTESIICKLSC